MPLKTQPGYDTEQIESDLAALRGQVNALTEYAEITTLVVSGVVVAQQPGTSTEPQTQEPWHAFNPLSNSWTVPAGGYADYRLTPMNELQIWAWIKSPGSGVDGVTIATFPVGYRPQVTVGFPVATDSANAIGSAGLPNAFMTITSGGVMQATGCSISGNVYINVKIPLDTPV